MPLGIDRAVAVAVGLLEISFQISGKLLPGPPAELAVSAYPVM
jgi:hypothetical protein